MLQISFQASQQVLKTYGCVGVEREVGGYFFGSSYFLIAFNQFLQFFLDIGQAIWVPELFALLLLCQFRKAKSRAYS